MCDGDASVLNQLYAVPTPAPMHCVSGFAMNNVHDMTMKMTETVKRALVRECVKKVLFRRINFLGKNCMVCIITFNELVHTIKRDISYNVKIVFGIGHVKTQMLQKQNTDNEIRSRTSNSISL